MTLRSSLLLLLIVAAATPNPRYFRYQRAILNTPSQNQQTCVALDPVTFAHAGPQLASLRLYSGPRETPYALHNAGNTQSPASPILPLNLGVRGGHTTFDAATPDGSYRNVTLDVDAKDFIATVQVSGSQTQTGAGATSLGSYTIFDFTRQKLGRSTVLHLPLSNFRDLHFRIDGPVTPAQVTGINIQTAAQAPPEYINVASSATIKQQGRDSIIQFTVPANVPVDRILFTPGSQPANFSRDVAINVSPTNPQIEDEREAPFPNASLGNILRLHTVQNGRKINEESLAVDAPVSPIRSATKWTITIHNQDDLPITLQSIALQMTARMLCFDAQPGGDYALYYGDPALTAPHYDYAQLFALDRNAARATLGQEHANPLYQPRRDTRPFTERHPALLWIALIVAILILGALALRSNVDLQRSK